VERLLPEFYPLKSGLTTGTCATAAAIAATRRLLTNETPRQVTVVLPNGESISVPVDYTDGHAFCKKEAGDDPDVTNGLEIWAEVSITREENTDIVILGGKGVGRFTLPGFDFPPGEPAINKSPRQMITANIKALLKEPAHVEVTISVPQGEEIAQRTFNPRLGIEGGISIIGVSGIVKPFSEEAFIESIHKCMEVAKAAFADTCCTDMERVVLNSGAKSERYVKALYPTLPRQAFVEYGNYIGETLKMARELGFSRVTLGVMLGKAVKLAEGQLDTHSKKGTMNKDFICQMLDEASCQADLTDMTLARELWQRIEKGKIEAFCRVVIRHCLEHCQPLVPQAQLTLLLIDDDGTIHSL
jgi:cobalt-precorrin-5B (C1)-methyltransferase